ncbi:MAG: adenylate cyclase [Mariniblastus sp.]
MATEIERKFLVTGDAWRNAPSLYYCQGYLNDDKLRTVRVRVAGPIGWLTIKGQTVGISRKEFEYEIPLADALEMLQLCYQPLIEKNRRIVKHDGNNWEVDEFLKENAGLVVAELELETPNQSFSKPDWIGKEVTTDKRYFNSRLASHPFSKWDDST